MNWGGKVVVVTGAARGIGKAIAQHFICLGARVAACDINSPEEGLNQDLSKPLAGASLIGAVWRRYGRIDVLVNNARAALRQKLGEEDEESWAEEIAVGITTPYFLGKYAIAEMQPGSSIVNIGSVTSYTVSGESAGYQVAKGACQQLTRVLAQLGASRGVRCNCVLPGSIVKGNHPHRTEMANVHLAAEHGVPQDVAQAVEYLTTARFVNGASIVVDGGLTIQDNWLTWKRARGLE